MEPDIFQIVDEATTLELNVAQLYLHFHHKFPDDSAFWWQLALEEKNHAALLRSGWEHLIKAGKFPSEIVPDALNPLVAVNKRMEIILAEIQERTPSREEAFRLAIQLEESAGEIHFETFIKMPPKTTDGQMFQILNQDDKDHARRLRAYAKAKGLYQEEF
jgi:hypothetical protein